MKETLQEKAYNWILDKIKNREYLPGTALNKEVIAQQMNISTTPVREALRLLEREGWVEDIPYRGSFLKQYSLHELREVAVLRENAEMSAISFIVKNGTDHDWERLEKILKESDIVAQRIIDKDGTEKELTKECRNLDERFHSCLIEASHSPKLSEMSSMWNLQLQNYAVQNFHQPTFLETGKRGKPQFYWINEQHRAIYTALLLKWEEGAKQLVKAHISSVCEYLNSIECLPHEEVKTSKKKKRNVANAVLCS